MPAALGIPGNSGHGTDDVDWNSIMICELPGISLMCFLLTGCKILLEQVASEPQRHHLEQTTASLFYSSRTGPGFPLTCIPANWTFWHCAPCTGRSRRRQMLSCSKMPLPARGLNSRHCLARARARLPAACKRITAVQLGLNKSSLQLWHVGRLVMRRVVLISV